MAGFKKGIKSGMYSPVFPEKWVITESFDGKGKAGIKYRSSWELKFMRFCDYNNNIIRCNSEGMVIPYLSPIDNKMHKYYMDFMLETKQGIWLVEVKPFSETQPPKPPRRNAKNPEKAKAYYEKALKTFVVNQAKWEATRVLCNEKGWKFTIITEKELGL